ncbi:MAG TPA: response regulator [Flavisolibacter sp.]|nr:response regulator [Flavisolibacter sp.]
MEANANKIIILYAEDDYDDFETVQEVLTQLTNHHELKHVKNGVEAIEFLQNTPDLPGLIVLDLNMPIMDGKEVLSWLKLQEQLKQIPSMVFTTSSREDDIKFCQKYNCTFFRKPTLYRDLLHIVQTMLQMCVSTNQTY